MTPIYGFHTQDPGLIEHLELLKELAVTSLPILITGQTGVGKEILARGIHHEWSAYRGQNRPFVAVNCAGITATLAEAELFGSVKGAYTGSLGNRKGYFQLAHGGTLFLDEIGDMPLELQPKILRAIQDKQVWPIGSERPKECDVRIVSATNQRIEDYVAARQFREDLFYRINGARTHIPPLHERPKDAALLARLVDQDYAKQEFPHRDYGGIDDDALDYLTNHPWPGNVRQLQSTILGARRLAKDNPITIDVLLKLTVAIMPLQEPKENGQEVVILDTVIRNYVLACLKHFNWNMTKTSEALDVGHRTLRLWVAKWRKDGVIIPHYKRAS